MDINMNLNQKKLVGLSFKCEDCDMKLSIEVLIHVQRSLMVTI
jgi:hypothetical protein